MTYTKVMYRVRPSLITKLRKEFTTYHDQFMKMIFYQHKQIYVSVNIKLLQIEVQLMWHCAYNDIDRDCMITLTADTSYKHQLKTLSFWYDRALYEASTFGETPFEELFALSP